MTRIANLQMRTRTHADPRRRGAVLVWVAMLGLVLVGFVGLAMDGAVVLLAGNQLQVAADAAALAGAWCVKDDAQFDWCMGEGSFGARYAAYNIAVRNKAANDPIRLRGNPANVPDGDIVVGRFQRAISAACPNPPCFLPTTSSPNAVRVNARRTSDSPGGQVPLVFGSAPGFGIQGVNVTRTATAMIAGSTGAAVLVLEDDPRWDCSFWMLGKSVLTVAGTRDYDGESPIQVNSSHDEAVCFERLSHAAPELYAPETNVVGGANVESGGTWDSVLNEHSPTMGDPLGDLPAPPMSVPRHLSIKEGGIYQPGYYPGGIDIKGTSAVKLEPGIYVVDKGISVADQAAFQANGVMLYVRTGAVRFTGTGSVEISAMTPREDPSRDYVGISMFQARSNTSRARIRATQNMSIGGTLYFPTASELRLTGQTDHFANQLIAWRLCIDNSNGAARFKINYDGRFPSPNQQVYLVE